VILLGTPADNPLIKMLRDEKFLPYAPDEANLPGPQRGMYAWQRDGVGPGQESITLIAYDEAGMSEAVGSFYEAAAGLDPLTHWALPASDSLTTASKADVDQVWLTNWSTVLPDRVVGLSQQNGQIEALSHDGSITTLDASGKVIGTKVLGRADSTTAAAAMATKQDAAVIAAMQQQIGSNRMIKFIVPHGGATAIASWGGTLELRNAAGAVQRRSILPQDVTALLSVGGSLVVGLADGRLLSVK
jgi:hypothetical protein